MVCAARSSCAISSAGGFTNMATPPWPPCPRASSLAPLYDQEPRHLSAQEHSVRIEPHGRTLRVTPGQPVLEAALSAGLNLPHRCKSGHFLLCQARANSDLTVRARLIASVADVEIKTLPCRIARLRPLAPDVMQLWL